MNLSGYYLWVKGRARARILDAENVCGNLMTQLAPFFDGATIELLQKFEQAVYGLTSPAPRKACPGNRS